MELKKTTKTRMGLLSWLTVLFFCFYISGFKSTYVNYITSALAIGLTMVYILFRRHHFMESVWKSGRFKAFTVFLLLFFYYLYIFGDGGVKATVAQYYLHFPLIISLYYEKESENARGIFWMLVIAWIFFALRAYYMYSNDLIEARGMAAHQVQDNVLTGGGYGFAYGSAIMAVYLFEMLMWGNIKKNKIWVCVLVVLLTMVVLETRSTLTIIAVMLGFMASVMFKIFKINTVKNISISHFLLFVFVIVAVILFMLYREELGMFIIKHTNNAEDIVGKRIREIGVFFAHSDSNAYVTSDMSGRLNRLNSSWDLFMENPLFGVVYKYGSNSHMLKMKGLGSHGEFLDILAKYGIIGGILLLGIYFATLKEERKKQKNKIGFGYIITFCVMFYFNPFLSNQSSTVFFFIIPAITQLFNSNKNKEGDRINENIHNAGNLSVRRE